MIVALSILVSSLVNAYNFQTVFNPFTGRLDYHVTENFTGYNITADSFTGDGSGLTGVVANANSTFNQTYQDYSYNFTLEDLFNYNETLIIFTHPLWYNQTDTIFFYNQSDTVFFYNQSDGSFNSTYNSFSYNQSLNVPDNSISLSLLNITSIDTQECSSGDFVTNVTFNEGVLSIVCDTPSESGDITSVQGDQYITNGSDSGNVVLIFNDTLLNQTIDGRGCSSISTGCEAIYLGSTLNHFGDPNTYFVFTHDNLEISIGGLIFTELNEQTSGSNFTINPGGAEIYFYLYGNLSEIISTNGVNDTIGFFTGIPQSKFYVNSSINSTGNLTLQGNYISNTTNSFSIQDFLDTIADTNATTECDDDELLDGNGDCVDFSGWDQDTTDEITNNTLGWNLSFSRISSLNWSNTTISISQILGINGGTDLTADLEEETHASEHNAGGADPIAVTTGIITDNTVALADVAHTITLASNPALASGQCFWSTTGIICEGSTANTIEILLNFTDPVSTDKVITFPNQTGTVLLRQPTTGNINISSNFTINSGGSFGFFYDNGTCSIWERGSSQIAICD